MVFKVTAVDDSFGLGPIILNLKFLVINAFTIC